MFYPVVTIPTRICILNKYELFIKKKKNKNCFEYKGFANSSLRSDAGDKRLLFFNAQYAPCIRENTFIVLRIIQGIFERFQGTTKKIETFLKKC